MLYFRILLLLSLVAKQTIAQNPEANSQTKKDSLSRYLSAMQQFTKSETFDSCLLLAKPAVEIALRENKKKELGKALYYAAKSCYNLGNYRIAGNLFDLTYRVRTLVNDTPGVAVALTGMAVVREAMNDQVGSLQLHLRAMKMREAARDSQGILASVHNLAALYYMMDERGKSHAFYLRALELERRLHNVDAEASTTLGLGTLYTEEKNYTEASNCFKKGLSLYEQVDDVSGQAYAYTNLGQIYAFMHRCDDAVRCLKRSIELRSKINDKGGLANSYATLAEAYKECDEWQPALMYAKKAVEAGAQIDDIKDVFGAYSVLYELYEKMPGSENAKLALDYYKRYIALRDSMTNEENTRKNVRLEMNYEFEKKEAAARLEQSKKDVVAAAEARRQRVILLSISIFGLLVLGFAIYAWRSFIQKKRANFKISRQKELIEEKQREILDSIHYARRIQSALLPQEKYLLRVLQKRS